MNQCIVPVSINSEDDRWISIVSIQIIEKMHRNARMEI